MSPNTRSAVLIFALAVSSVRPVHAADAPAIPAPFQGTWRAADGTCETAPSTGVLIDANEVMFGETGFFVSSVSQLDGKEIEIVASQPPESSTQSTIHFRLRLSKDGKALLFSQADLLTSYRRCDRR